jgi:hypothetical protein
LVLHGKTHTVVGSSVVDRPPSNNRDENRRKTAVVEPQGARKHSQHSIRVLNEHERRLLELGGKLVDNLSNPGVFVALEQPSEGSRATGSDLFTLSDLHIVNSVRFA